MTVEEVINEFDKLHMRCDVVEEEEQIKAKSKGSTSRFTPPTRTAPPTALLSCYREARTSILAYLSDV
ncbi:hypothetical protein Tco_0156936 [Tanacetum coccineum]